jgi:hypothetical protein
MAKYRSFKVLKSLIPNFVHSEYDSAKFKVICDDLGLANLIVRSRQDLTVIGVVDLEWWYVGPAQLFGSAPWWLLMDRPTNQAWDCDTEEPTRITARYFRYLVNAFWRKKRHERQSMRIRSFLTSSVGPNSQAPCGSICSSQPALTTPAVSLSLSWYST